MTSFMDWVFSHIKVIRFNLTTVSIRKFLSQDSQHEELGNQGLSQTSADIISPPVSTETTCSTSSVQLTENPLSPQAESSSGSNVNIEEKNLDPLAKVEALQINFLCLLRRLGPSDNLTVAKVLYRIHLAGESDLGRANLKSDRARAVADEQEETGVLELNFSIKILVLGKTGVGKSSTINSILGGSKVMIDAFRPATNRVREIVGTVNGIRLFH